MIAAIAVPRVVKKLMRRPNGNISTAGPRARYSRLSCQHDFLLLGRLEIKVCCLYPDDFVRHGKD